MHIQQLDAHLVAGWSSNAARCSLRFDLMTVEFSCVLLTAHRSLLTTRCLLLTACCSMSTVFLEQRTP
jgi:hypothetical protein